MVCSTRRAALALFDRRRRSPALSQADRRACARQLEELRREVLAMRHRMADAHANKSALFDLKHDRGGIIDVEFIVQDLVLGYAHRFSRLTANLGNIALLGIAGEMGLIDATLARQVGMPTANTAASSMDCA